MANFGNIIEWVLRLEDRTLAGKVVDLGDGAGFTRFGLTSKNCRTIPQDFWGNMPNDQALEVAKQYYYDHEWKAIEGTKIVNDDVAATLMSFAVNDGVASAVELLEGILHLDKDGVFGPSDLEAVNLSEPEHLAAALRDAQEARYQEIERLHPSDRKFDRGWRARAYVHFPDLP